VVTQSCTSVIREVPGAETVLARMRHAYATATTYSDHWTYVATTGSSSWRADGGTTFVRGQRIVVTSTEQDSTTLRTSVWSDFTHTYTHQESDHETTTYDDGIRLRDAFSPSWNAGEAPERLLPGLSPRKAAPPTAALATIHEVQLDGRDCWLVSTVEDRTTVDLWLDRDTYLIRKQVSRLRDGEHTFEQVTTIDPILDAPIDLSRIPGPDLAAHPASPRPINPPSSEPRSVANHAARLLQDRPPPALDVSLADGSRVTLDDVRGHVVILAFTSPSCVPCAEMLYPLKLLSEQHPELIVIALAEGITRSGRISNFIYADDPGLAISSAYSAFPDTSHLVLIDQEGIVRYVEIGPNTSKFASAIELYASLLLL
jgi:hypothetical protein